MPVMDGSVGFLNSFSSSGNQGQMVAVFFIYYERCGIMKSNEREYSGGRVLPESRSRYEESWQYSV